jgi:hypothetical protein
MAVYLLQPYGGFPASSTNPVIFPPSTETALIADGRATAAGTTGGVNTHGGPGYYATQGGNKALIDQAGVGRDVANVNNAPLVLPVIAMGSLALTSYETNGTVPVAGTMYLTEINVPFTQTWTGIAKLNGTTVGSDNHLVALYGADGTLLANSAVAGVLSAVASVFQNIAFTAPITLIPGRYFLGVQSNGNTDTLRHLETALGVSNNTGSQAGVFGTIPATLTTVPVTTTNAQGVLCRLYV